MMLISEYPDEVTIFNTDFRRLQSFSAVIFLAGTKAVSSEVEMNRTWTDNIILFQTLQLYTRLYIKHQIRFNKLD